MNTLRVSRPLAGVMEVNNKSALYERTGDVALESGLQPYASHTDTNLETHSALSASEVWQLNSLHTLDSDCAIACVGIPATSVGQRGESASQCGVRVILLCRQGNHLSRITQGRPHMGTANSFGCFEEARHQVQGILEERQATTGSGAVTTRRKQMYDSACSELALLSETRIASTEALAHVPGGQQSHLLTFVRLLCESVVEGDLSKGGEYDD